MKENRLKIFSEFQGKKEELIPLLQRVQEVEGFLSEEAMAEIAKFLRIPASDLYGVATFYSQFKFLPGGKHLIKICHGTACHVQKAQVITETIMNELNVIDGATTEDGLFTFESVSCIGCCSLAPVMTINDDTHGKLAQGDISKILKRYH